MINKKLIIVLAITVLLTGCISQNPIETDDATFNSWDEVKSIGEGKEVSILMWGGNESINQYMDGFVAQKVDELYGISLKRIPMNAPEFMSKLLNEKKGGVDHGTADLLWINGENFSTAKQGELLWGPFTELLPNLQLYYDTDADDLKYDTGIAIDGYEAIWGRAQLVLTHDSIVLENPPKSFGELANG
jgi:putative spermidine/putrescine transport system substrate-binding protein